MFGVRCFFRALKAIFRDPQVFQWFRGTVLVGFGVALAVLVMLLVGGSWMIMNSATHWAVDLGAVLWVLLLIYFSGTLCLVAMSVVVSVWGNEEKLMRALLADPTLSMGPARWRDRGQELGGALISLAMSLLSLPFFFFIPLMPVGVLLMAWAVGREACSAARRILHQCPRPVWVHEWKAGTLFYIGVGTGPILFTFVPIVGWMTWPILLVSALIALMKAPKQLVS